MGLREGSISGKGVVFLSGKQAVQLENPRLLKMGDIYLSSRLNYSHAHILELSPPVNFNSTQTLFEFYIVNINISSIT